MSEKHWEQLKNGAPIYDEEGNVYGFEDKLIYDKKSGRFILTIDAVKNELNVNLTEIRESHENARAFLDELSLLLYSYIYKKKNPVLRRKKEYYLTFDLRNRRILYECMIDMLRYSFYSGGNIMAYQPGVNLNETGEINIEELRNERIVSYVTDSLLKTNFLVDRNFVEDFQEIEEDWRE